MRATTEMWTHRSLAGTLTAALLAACTPAQIHEEPIIYQGGRVGEIEGTATASENAREREEIAGRRDSIALEALATCAPDVCDALLRGEVALDMTETQVLAATGTTPEAWSVRYSGLSTVMVPSSMGSLPEDAVGPLAMVQIRGGGVSSYGYREAQGIRVVSSPADATTEGRADALAEAMIREGDELVARGAFDAALNRYDRADVLRPGDPMTTFRIATALDKQLRPIQALIQYQLFLHQLNLERIEARGDADAKLAEAIAQARARIIFIERGGQAQSGEQVQQGDQGE
jgi:hypothetical protein